MVNKEKMGKAKKFQKINKKLQKFGKKFDEKFQKFEKIDELSVSATKEKEDKTNLQKHEQ